MRLQVDPGAKALIFDLDGTLGMEAARSAGMIVTDVRPFVNFGTRALS